MSAFYCGAAPARRCGRWLQYSCRQLEVSVSFLQPAALPSGMVPPGDRRVLNDLAIAHDHVALAVAGDVRFVRDHDNRNPMPVELLEHVHNVHAGAAVE